MRKIYLLLLPALLFGAFTAQATMHTIQAKNFQFTPNTLSVHVGDTIRWTWINGSHTTTSLSVPAGAATWDHPIATSSQSFIYVITAPGTYTYECTPHAPDMAGSFTASGLSAVSNPANASAIFTLRSNVIREDLNVNINLDAPAQVNIRLYNLVGRLVRTYTTSRRGAGTYEESYLVGDLPKGLYLLSLEAGNQQITRRIIVE